MKYLLEMLKFLIRDVFINQFNLFGGDYSILSIQNKKGFINEFNLCCDFNSIFEVVPGSKIGRLKFVGKFYQNAVIDISHISLRELIFYRVKNFGLITIVDLKFGERNSSFTTKKDNDGILSFKNSFLNKTKFISVDFRSASKIVVENTDISGASIQSGYFPTSVEKVFSSETNYGKNLADFYNDLANMMKRQGNKRMELNYIATHQSLLKQSLNWRTDFGDWFSLFLSKWSNKYGTSWWRALWLCLFTIPYVLFFIYSFLPGIDLWCWQCPFKWELIFNHVVNFLNFTLPNIFKFNFWNENGNLVALGLSISAKLIFAYGVYQFVQAFRRLGRR